MLGKMDMRRFVLSGSIGITCIFSGMAFHSIGTEERAVGGLRDKLLSVFAAIRPARGVDRPLLANIRGSTTACGPCMKSSVRYAA